jgi:two-component system LytT family response regulator
MNAAARRALLIDDEPLARLELRRLLQAHPHVVVTGEASTMTEARAQLARQDYDLVFLDIQLRGGNGFDLLVEIAPSAQVIFVTAYDRYAVRAFEVNALDYLLKPVTASRLVTALGRLDRVPPANDDATAAATPRLTADDRVYVKTGSTTRFVPLSNLGAIRSCENYTELHLTTGEKLLVLRSLKSWEESLPAETFVRVHRQTLVNLTHVAAIRRTGDDEVLFELTAPVAAVSASRRQLAELRHRFAAAGLEGLLPR